MGNRRMYEVTLESTSKIYFVDEEGSEESIEDTVNEAINKQPWRLKKQTKFSVSSSRPMEAEEISNISESVRKQRMGLGTFEKPPHPSDVLVGEHMNGPLADAYSGGIVDFSAGEALLKEDHEDMDKRWKTCGAEDLGWEKVPIEVCERYSFFLNPIDSFGWRKKCWLIPYHPQNADITVYYLENPEEEPFNDNSYFTYKEDSTYLNLVDNYREYVDYSQQKLPVLLRSIQIFDQIRESLTQGKKELAHLYGEDVHAGMSIDRWVTDIMFDNDYYTNLVSKIIEKELSKECTDGE